MILSDEQTRVVRHGVGPEPSYEWVDLPVGPQPIPSWAKGLSIWWAKGYANSPSYTIKATEDLRAWDGKRFNKIGSRYMATAPDGRAEVYYHDGAITLETFNRGPLPVPNQVKDGIWTLQPWPEGPPEQYQVLATTVQSGFGGSRIDVAMAGDQTIDLSVIDKPAISQWSQPTWRTEKRSLRDGELIALRGPWHGGSPPRYMDVAYVDMSCESTRRYMHLDRRRRPWHAQTARGGLFITGNLFLRLLARFAPECRCAKVTISGSTYLEAVRGDWDEPKHWVQARKRGVA